MKRSIIIIMVYLLVFTPNKAGATFKEYDIVAKSNKEKIALYAKKIDGLYQNFKIHFKGEHYSRPFWINVTNPSYTPQIYFEDINKDAKKELIIILTKGYGTGVLDQEIYVYRYTNGLVEVLVDNPLAIINKNVKTKLTPTKAKVSIGNKNYALDISPVGIKPEDIFNDIHFGSIIKYEVENHQLLARIEGQVSSAHFIGEVIITYEYRDKMYQVKSIDFHPFKQQLVRYYS